MACPSKSSSVVSCRHSTTGCCRIRASVCAMCGARMSCQPSPRFPSRDWSKNRYTACVSAQSAHAAGMLAVGLSAKRVASLMSRRFKRRSPSAAPPNSSSAQVLIAVPSQKEQQQSKGYTSFVPAGKKNLPATVRSPVMQNALCGILWRRAPAHQQRCRSSRELQRLQLHVSEHLILPTDADS